MREKWHFKNKIITLGLSLRLSLQNVNLSYCDFLNSTNVEFIFILFLSFSQAFVVLFQHSLSWSSVSL